MAGGGRRVGLGLAVAILAALAMGCGLGGDDGDDEAAKEAAAAYQADLDAFVADLKGAERQRLARMVAEAPVLEEVDSDEASYVAARELAGRVETIESELALLADIDPRKFGRFDHELYSAALGFADSVIERSTDYQFGVPFEDRLTASAAAEQRRATNAIEREIEAWKPYRRKVAAMKAPDELTRSMHEFEMEEIDDTLGMFERFRGHLRQTKPDSAALGYWDDLWPLEDPLRLLPAGVFSSKGDRYLESIYRGDRIIRSEVRAIQTLAREGEVGPDSPLVGNAYREAILAGFVSPLEKVKYKQYRINFRAWMLNRIRELEVTPRREYEEALQTLWIELIEDDRNPYDRLLAALNGFNAIGVTDNADVARLRMYMKLIDEELADPIAPILEPTRNAFLRALDSIRLEDFHYPGRDASIEEISDAFDAIERARKSLTEAEDKIERAMNDGAKRVDSAKQLRRALERALEATKP